MGALEAELSAALRAQNEAERELHSAHQSSSQLRVVSDEASRLLEESKRRLQARELELEEYRQRVCYYCMLFKNFYVQCNNSTFSSS